MPASIEIGRSARIDGARSSVALGDVKAVVGHRFTFDVGQWGRQSCEVIAVEPERLFRYRFALDTTITWRLRPEGTGTTLLLEHSGFGLESPLAKAVFHGMSGGWLGILERIAPVIDQIGEFMLCRLAC